jgi:hypothetical protein
VQEKQKNSGISHLLSLVRCLPLSDFYLSREDSHLFRW